MAIVVPARSCDVDLSAVDRRQYKTSENVLIGRRVGALEVSRRDEVNHRVRPRVAALQ